MSKNTTKAICKLSQKVLKANLTGTTSFFAYQPVVPSKAKQYLDKKENK